MRDPVLVCAHPGAGKTTAARQFNNIEDLDKIYCTKKDIDDLFWLYGKFDKNILAMPILGQFITKFSALERKLGSRIILAYPSIECVDEYMDRYHERGDDMFCFYTRRDLLVRSIEGYNKLKTINVEKVPMKPKEYLTDVLAARGLVDDACKNENYVV